MQYDYSESQDINPHTLLTNSEYIEAARELAQVAQRFLFLHRVEREKYERSLANRPALALVDLSVAREKVL
jgi:hypothetical protein